MGAKIQLRERAGGPSALVLIGEQLFSFHRVLPASNVEGHLYRTPGSSLTVETRRAA